MKLSKAFKPHYKALMDAERQVRIAFRDPELVTLHDAMIRWMGIKRACIGVADTVEDHQALGQYMDTATSKAFDVVYHYITH